MRRVQEYRALILSGGIALYAIGMWLAWFDEQTTFGPSPWANHEVASSALALAGSFFILFGTIVQGWRLANARRAVAGAVMIVAAFAMVWFWDHGINFLYLGPSIHGWSAGFLLLPLLLLVSGSGWLLMAMWAAVRSDSRH